MLRICQKLKLNNVHANARNSHAPPAVIWPIATRFSYANCMTSAIWLTIARLICRSLTHSTAVQSAKNISMPTLPTWQTPVATIPEELFTWQSGWLWKMVCHIGQPRGIYGETIGFLFRGPRFKTGLRQREKKAEQRAPAEYLDGALADFSGYIAIDELYDGPFCVLSIVDNHDFRRLIYEVLDHDPTHEDIIRFLCRFRKELEQRGLELLGVTSDGSPLYPEPLVLIFPGVKHQVCEFHVLMELNKQTLKAVTAVRREIKKKLPKLKRGRPSSQADRKASLRKKRLQDKISNLFEHRYLFVKHSLTAKEKKIFLRITRGLYNLRNLRSIMDEVYRLFDRRCRTETALEKLAKLRCRVLRFKSLSKTLKKLFTPNIEKALIFLDDSQLPSTSNAVERGYRRHRKMQKSVYRVRTQKHISQRIAIDMQREELAQGRLQTIQILHNVRNGIGCSR